MIIRHFRECKRFLLAMVLCSTVFLPIVPVSGDGSIPITPTNAAHLAQVKTLGRGIPQRIDGTVIGVAVTTSLGMWLYPLASALPPSLIGQDGRVALSRDGKWAGAFDRQHHVVTLYDIAAGKDYPLETGISEVPAIAFSPDGSYLAVNVDSKFVGLWKVAAPEQGIRITEPAKDVWFSDDNRFLLIGQPKTIVFWDIAAGRLQPGLTRQSTDVGRIAQGGQSLSLIVSEYHGTAISVFGGRRITFQRSFGESADRTLMAVSLPASGHPMLLWNVLTNTSQGFLQGQTTSPLSVAFSTDNQWAATANSDGTLSIWAVKSGRLQVNVRADGTLFAEIGFNRDATEVFAVDSRGRLWTWALTHDDKTQRFSASAPQSLGNGYTSSVTDIAFSPDAKLLAASAAVAFDVYDRPETRDLYVWHLPDGDEQQFSIGDHTKKAVSVTFSPDGIWLAATSENTARLWDVATGRLRYVLPKSVPDYSSAIFSPSNALLIAPGNDFLYGPLPALGLFDLTTGGLYPLQIVPKGRSIRLALSPDGRELAIAQGDPSYGETSTTELWDVVTGKHLTSLTGNQGKVIRVLFSPDGRYLATSEFNGAVRLWTLSTGHPITLMDPGCVGGGYASLAFSPDSRLLAGAGDYTCAVALWNVEGGVPIGTLSGTAGTTAVAFSPDGDALATGMRDGTVRLWRID